MQSKPLWLAYLAQNKIKVTAILVLGIISSIGAILVPLSIGKFIEIVFLEHTSKSRVLEILGIRLSNSLNVFITFFVGVIVIKFIAAFFHSYYSGLLGDTYVQYLRRELVKNYIEKKQSSNKKNNASILLLFTSEIKTIQRYIVKGVIGFTKDIFLLIIAIYILASINILLSIIIALLIITFYITLRFLNKSFVPHYANKRNQQAKMIGFVASKITGTLVNEDDNVIKEYDNLDSGFSKQKKLYTMRRSFLAAITPFFLSLLLFAVMVFTLVFTKKAGALSASVVLMYTLVLITVFSTIRNLLKVEGIWAEGDLAIRKFNRVILKNIKLEGQIAAQL